MAKAVEDHWPGPLEGLVVTRYGHAVPLPADRDRRGAHPCPTPPASGRRADPGARPRRRARRPRLVPDLRRRLRAPGPAGRGPDARGQAGGQQGAARLGRRHRPDEHGAPAPLGDQGRPARRRGPPGQGGEPLDLRRAGRRSVRDRLGPDRADPTTFADARAILARYGIEPPPAVRAHLERGRGGDAQARRPAAGRGRDGHRRDAAGEPGGGGRGRAHGRRGAAHPGRRAGGRGARGRPGHGRDRAPGRRHGQPLRAPCVLLSGGETTVTVRGKGGAAGATPSSCWASRSSSTGWRGVGDRRRHRRDRRQRGQRRGDRHPRRARAGAGARAQAGRAARRQRRLRLLRGRWAISSSPARPSPTSTTSAPCSSRAELGRTAGAQEAAPCASRSSTPTRRPA